MQCNATLSCHIRSQPYTFPLKVPPSNPPIIMMFTIVFSTTPHHTTLSHLILQGIFGALMVINSFPAERTLSLRERAAGSYYVSAYFLAKSTAEMVFHAFVPVIFTCTGVEQ